ARCAPTLLHARSPPRGIGEPLHQRLAAPFAYPGGKVRVQPVRRASPWVLVRRDVDSLRARLLDLREDLGHAAEVRAVCRLQMPDLRAYIRCARDPEDLVEGGVDPPRLGALVREVRAAVRRRGLRERDELLGRRVDVRDVLERGETPSA